MARRNKKNSDPVAKRLDRVIELLESLAMMHGKRYGLTRDEIRAIVSVDANRISKVTRGVVAVSD